MIAIVRLKFEECVAVSKGEQHVNGENSLSLRV